MINATKTLRSINHSSELEREQKWNNLNKRYFYNAESYISIPITSKQCHISISKQIEIAFLL